MLRWKLHPSGLRCRKDCLYIQKARNNIVYPFYFCLSQWLWVFGRFCCFFGVGFLLVAWFSGFFWLVFIHSLLLPRKIEAFSPSDITRKNPVLIVKPSSNLQRNSTHFSASPNTLLKLAVAQKYIHNTSDGSFQWRKYPSKIIFRNPKQLFNNYSSNTPSLQISWLASN